jgi:hypothetical protein
MIGAFLMCLGGRTEIRIQGGEGAVFSGIGPLGIKRCFQTSDDPLWFVVEKLVLTRYRYPIPL